MSIPASSGINLFMTRGGLLHAPVGALLRFMPKVSIPGKPSLQAYGRPKRKITTLIPGAPELDEGGWWESVPEVSRLSLKLFKIKGRSVEFSFDGAVPRAKVAELLDACVPVVRKLN